MSKNIIILISVLTLLTTSLWATRTTTPPSPIDHLNIATILVYDGKYKKALSELRLVNRSDTNFDSAKYYTTKGVIYLRIENYNRAIKNLNIAIKKTKTKRYIAPKIEEEKPKYLFSLGSHKKTKKTKNIRFYPEKIRAKELGQLYIQLSQAYYKNKNYQGTINSLDRAGKIGRDRPALFTLRAECYWKLKQHSNALDILTKGSKLFPKDSILLKQKFYYFVELKLYQSAITSAKEYMKRSKASAKEYIVLGQMLMGANQRDSAIKVLEEAKILFPNEAKISMLLGHLYLKKGMTHTTAHLFEQASYYNSKYTKESAEMYRRSGNLPHAIYLNSQIKDKVEKLKQKVAIYIGRNEFDKIIGLKDALDRYKMLSDDNILYALAYAYYIVKDYENAEELFKKITNSELFSKATIVRKNIEKCRDNSMECI